MNMYKYHSFIRLEITSKFHIIYENAIKPRNSIHCLQMKDPFGSYDGPCYNRLPQLSGVTARENECLSSPFPKSTPAQDANVTTLKTSLKHLSRDVWIDSMS